MNDTTAASVESLNLDPYWMPFTHNRYFKAKRPLDRLLVGAEGAYYTTSTGQKLFDGLSGLWCSGLGHGDARIKDAVKRQLDVADYIPAFQVASPDSFRLAERIAQHTPEDLNRVFFTNSGSEAVDTALKIAVGYHRLRGEASRTRIIGRERGYHGVGLGGISIGGMVANRKMFAPLMIPGVDHLPHTHSLKDMAYSDGQPAWGAHLADELLRIINVQDASTIAAVIVEPVAGSTGVLPPPKGYLERLRELCTQHGILLIFDEVITGFGRLGTMFAADRYGVTPDLITCAKGLTNGTIPMGAVLAQPHVYEAVTANVAAGPELAHGYTYSGHPVACAAGMASLEIYRNEGLYQRSAEMAPYFEAAVHSLKGGPHVVDIRNAGLLGAVELEAVPGQAGKFAQACHSWCFDQGVMVRAVGDTVVMSPPLIIERSQVDQLVSTLSEALAQV